MIDLFCDEYKKVINCNVRKKLIFRFAFIFSFLFFFFKKYPSCQVDVFNKFWFVIILKVSRNFKSFEFTIDIFLIFIDFVSVLEFISYKFKLIYIELTIIYIVEKWLIIHCWIDKWQVIEYLVFKILKLIKKTICIVEFREMQYVTCQFTNSILLVNCKRLYIYEKFKSAKIYKILKKNIVQYDI